CSRHTHRTGDPLSNKGRFLFRRYRLTAVGRHQGVVWLAFSETFSSPAFCLIDLTAPLREMSGTVFRFSGLASTPTGFTRVLDEVTGTDPVPVKAGCLLTPITHIRVLSVYLFHMPSREAERYGRLSLSVRISAHPWQSAAYSRDYPSKSCQHYPGHHQFCGQAASRPSRDVSDCKCPRFRSSDPHQADQPSQHPGCHSGFAAAQTSRLARAPNDTHHDRLQSY